MTDQHNHSIEPKNDPHQDLYCHGHDFSCADSRSNENRTWAVIGITATMMVVEVAAGWWYGSMALLADGWHMASHAAALGITAAGYMVARKYKDDPRFGFGTGKVGDLAGFTSAVTLLLIALLMSVESARRLVNPVDISFREAIAVAVLGLVVNLVCAWLLKEHPHDHGHGHEPEHGHDHDHDHDHENIHADHNILSAYYHVLADALTSILAIAALVSGLFLGWVWMDPVMGIVGACVIFVWAVGLMRKTGQVLLDVETNPALAGRIRQIVEAQPETRVTDLHVWRIGPGHFSVIVSVANVGNLRPGDYKQLLHGLAGLSHVTVEVRRESPEQPKQ